ncbi:Ca2+-dependent phosphoinositide-specific phospholipase C [Sphingomonas sp. CJ20]
MQPLHTRILCGAALAVLALAGTAAARGDGPAPAPEAADLPGSLPINRIQVLGTHNSYSLPIDPQLRTLLRPIFAGFDKMIQALPAPQKALFAEEHPNPISIDEGLNYTHDGLTAQLDRGVRSLELDLNPDPQGGQYLDPEGYRLLRAQGAKDLLPIDTAALAKPGFKVHHITDADFRSHCALFTDCLRELRGWSDGHPGHVPLFILIEAKSQALPLFKDSKPALPFTADRFDAIDREILSVFPRERLVTPDDVRGRYPTLNAAVRAGNWPTLAKARGKILFLMITANGPAGAAGYLAGHPSLQGRVAFLRAQPGEDHAAFLMFDNAVRRDAEIRAAVAQGYLVRTRSDIETYEAKTNDPTRANTAFASGAQIVSTDFEHPGNAYGTPYVVRLPGTGAARRSPAFAPGR